MSVDPGFRQHWQEWSDWAKTLPVFEVPAGSVVPPETFGNEHMIIQDSKAGYRAYAYAVNRRFAVSAGTPGGEAIIREVMDMRAHYVRETDGLMSYKENDFTTLIVPFSDKHWTLAEVQAHIDADAAKARA